jgi:energy-coupling factor transporter ATP-binding protein EcfA2
MKLLRFRVKNFRSVVDSGWLDAGSVTALVGVNESGKTNLLLPLWKLNPARDGEIVPTSDYPKAQYAAIRANPEKYEFVEAVFSCSDLASEISTKTGQPENIVDEVMIGKRFDGQFTIWFPKFQPKNQASAAEISDILQSAASELSGISALLKEGSLKETLVQRIQQSLSQVASTGTNVQGLDVLATTLKAALPSEIAPTSSLVPRYQRMLNDLADLKASLQLPAPGQAEGVWALIKPRLPKFVYYSNYGNLDSEIYLPHVVENLKRTDLGAKEAAKARTLKVLFSFVRLEPEDILELGQEAQPVKGLVQEEDIAEAAERKRERTILLNSAGTDLTKKFKSWWRQGDYTFEFQADGDHFRIWVSDTRRPEKVELEDRSTGLQWFLSFYLIFLVESYQDHRDAILLLDEPGLSLHPLAQRDLSAFFENLSGTNQIIYTTHSPFLVDADMLDRARKVYISEDGSTKATSDLRRGSQDPRKSGATYAIYSALNMNVAESMLIGCHPVVVEGPSDQHYLSAIKTILIAAGKIKPARELIFPPAHGARNAQVIATILSGRDDVLPVMLLDGDAAGLKMAGDMRNGLYKGAKTRVVDTNGYVGFEDSEIEDLIPLDTIINVVDRWQKGADHEFETVAKPGLPVVPQIVAWAEAEGLGLDEGWKVELARRVKERLLARGPKDLEAEVIDQWSKLFNDIVV